MTTPNSPETSPNIGLRLVIAGSPAGKTFDETNSRAPVKLKFADVPHSSAHAEPALASMIVDASGRPISATPEAPELLDVRGETLNSLTWDTYLAWRKTKCRPYDYADCPVFATEYPFNGELDKINSQSAGVYGPARQKRAIEEIDQATLEFIGEVSELGEMFREHGEQVFFGDLRAKLIDEAGDCIFCGCWTLDAWGNNPFSGCDDLELVRVTEDDMLATMAHVIGIVTGEQAARNKQFASTLGGICLNLMLRASSYSGLLANSAKKLIYQRREQDVETQTGRVVNTLVAVNQILVLANSSIEEAMQSNMRKLDARFPNGYQPGQGGGIRTGEGK